MPTSYGDWLVEEQLGRGGMGVVWRCVHARTGVEGAVKVVPTDGAGQGLQRELFALSRVAHPQIVRILDHGTGEGHAWYAMARVEGGSLADHLPDPPICETFSFDDPVPEGPQAESSTVGLPLDEALALLASLCHPLATLHGAGLVHRDLKPDNVLLRPDGVPVLIDFGLAVPTVGDVGLDAAVAGTPQSIAPEQIRGELADARADLYALGCLAWTLLVGRPPFVGTVPAILEGHASQFPPLLSQLRPDVPPAVDELVATLLAKDRAQRPARALDVHDALIAAGARPPVVPGLPQPRPYVYRPRTTGRDAAVAALRGFLAEGRGAAWVSARSGAGKTRVLQDFARLARGARRVVLTVGCQADADGGPLPGLLRQVGALSGRRGGAPWWAEWGPLLARVAPGLGAVPGVALDPEPPELEPADAVQRLSVAVVEVLLRASASCPLALVVDDLQWADPSLRRVLALLVERAGEGRILVAGAWREEEEDAELVGLDGARIHLPPLDRDAVARLASDMLAAPAPAPLVDYLEAAAAGSPLWVSELVATAVQTGALAPDGRGWRLVRSPGVPAGSMDALLALRLSDLDAAVVQVLHRASLQGRDVELAWLGLPPEPVAEAALVLVRLGLWVDHGDRLAFAHDKLREAVFRAVPGDAAVLHHRALVEAIESLPASRRPLEALARHLVGAGEPLRAAATFEAAAARASDVGEQVRLWEAALGAHPTPDADTLSRRWRLFGVLRALDPQRAAMQVGHLVREAEILGTPWALGLARECQGQVLSHQGDLDGATAALHDALDSFETAGDVQARIRALRILALVRRLARDSDGVGAALDEALRLAGPAADFDLWQVAFLHRRTVGDREGARAALRQLEAAAPADGESVLVGLELLENDAPDPDLVARALDSAAGLERAGNLDRAGMTYQHVAVRLISAGRFEAAYEAIRKSLAHAIRIGNRVRQCYGWYYLAILERSIPRDLDAAERAAWRVVELSRAMGSPQDEADGYCQLGHIALVRDEDARPWRQRAVALLGSLRTDVHMQDALLFLDRAIQDRDAGLPLFHGSSLALCTPEIVERARAEGVRQLPGARD